MLAITGKDSVTIDTRTLTEFATGDTYGIEMPNNLAEYKQGKNGNAVIAYNASGEQGVLTLKLVRGGADDKFMMARMQEFINDTPSFVVVSGEVIKRLGDGAGNITADLYQLSGGAFQKMPIIKEDVEGDTDQATVTYTIIGNFKRILG